MPSLCDGRLVNIGIESRQMAAVETVLEVLHMEWYGIYTCSVRWDGRLAVSRRRGGIRLAGTRARHNVRRNSIDPIGGIMSVSDVHGELLSMLEIVWLGVGGV